MKVLLPAEGIGEIKNLRIMELDKDVIRVPLRIDHTGRVTVAGTDFELASLVADFQTGLTAEEIVDRHSGLQLSDAYIVLAYYLRERLIVESYLRLSRRSQAQSKAA